MWSNPLLRATHLTICLSRRERSKTIGRLKPFSPTLLTIPSREPISLWEIGWGRILAMCSMNLFKFSCLHLGLVRSYKQKNLCVLLPDSLQPVYIAVPLY